MRARNVRDPLRFMTIWRSGLLALGLLLGAGAAHAGDRLGIVATTGMIADAARAIGGDEVTVEVLMGSGVDPHSYRQTRSDILKLSRADLVLWHGLYLEAQMEGFLHRLERRQTVVAVAEALPRDRLIGHADYDDKLDPHVWMDPALWAEVVDGILEAMIEARPDAEDTFRRGAASYREEIAELDAYAEKAVGTVPTERRALVTAHDAFAYFGRRFDFDVIGIQGISTESEAGLRRIRDVVDLLVERDITAVFVESSVSDRNIRALVEGARSRGHDVQVAGTLYSDAMGKSGTYEGTYIGMIDHNVTTIVSALDGEVPADGMQEKLDGEK